ncbi:AAA family ATPase [Fulvivirga sp. M361]|uniref:UvrD-helicase domain-containing protein n=1 Tax=Fulvivirga sp. M361 TaxID=2594266 RepID=UPI00117A5240|nr:UvrD-helicase domain-containing protein [Fulvivirga sp. M361]TRX47147.1 AAA family ATPase [Fulvivirga sp. M361]
MTDRNFIIYQSSAGSGKTYTLAKEYLKLALRRPAYYKHILAVTFTNKAMQEMKGRILQKLEEFGRGDLDAMGEELMLYTRLSPSDFQKTCARLLTEILHGYSHFSISTIDSFFQKVIRSFAKELGLAGSYQLELDTDVILIQIVDDLLMEASQNVQIRKWLISYSRDTLQEGGNWDIRKNIIQLGSELFQEHFKTVEGQVAAQDKGLAGKLKKDLGLITKSFEEKMKSYGQEGLQILHKYGLETSDFTGGSRSPLNYLYKITKPKASKDFIPTKTVEALPDKEEWYAKASGKKEVITAATKNGLRAILQQTLEYYVKEFDTYHTAIQVNRFIYGYGLLADLARKLQEYKKDNDIMLISDATRFLKELVQDSDTPFVYEKVGSFFNHYLIDEFQDTSGFQWDSFRPLIDDSLSQGYKNTVVGDIKQSIYRWRGGDWNLLLNQVEEDIGSFRTQVENLGTNYRSEANIIQFNNALFEQAPQQMTLEGGDNRAEGWEVLTEVYASAKQGIPKSKVNAPQGYVNITFLGDEEDRPWKHTVAERLPEVIEELQDKQVALKDIAILVRRNKEGKDVADYLHHYQKQNPDSQYRYDVVSNESLFLSSSPAIRLIIAALQCLMDNKNQVVQAQLAFEYQVQIRRSCVSYHEIFSADYAVIEKLLPESFRENRTHLLFLPFYELVEQLIALFEVNQLKGQFAYLQTFQDLVLKSSQNGKGDLPSFLEWWKERGARQSIKVADDLDAMRILTIHKAKGLEYNAVIIPFCDWEMDHQRSPIIWSNAETPPFDNVYLPLKYQKGLAQTHFRDAYQKERIKAHLDNLNLLYVAMTRAIQTLWVFAPDGKKDISKVLKATLENSTFELNGYWDKEANVFEFGEQNFQFATTHSAVGNAILMEQYPHYEWRNKIAVKQTSGGHNLSEEVKEKIRYGILMHKLLSRITYLTDKEAAITAVFFEEGLNEIQRREIQQRLEKLLSNPSVSPWFSDEWEVKNEWPILTHNEEYRPDRVLIKGKKAVIIDYKTGLKKNEDIQQMHGYKVLMEQMNYDEVEGYLLYLAGEEIVEC